MLGMLFTLKMCAQPACEVNKFYAIKDVDPVNFKKQCMELHAYHKDLAVEKLQDLEYCCWYYPETSDREKAIAFFQASIASISASSSYAKLMAIFTSLVVSYGMVIIDQYHAMANRYYDAQYHLNLADFYLECALRY